MIRRYLARRKMRWAVRWWASRSLKQRRIADWQRWDRRLLRQRAEIEAAIIRSFYLTAPPRWRSD
ncbi:hypothetical protein LCGC14_0789980 [marine sediment metagenome]|uniref:Uncharacterized protein n=1 Tax=marine sediment metagenome TaxID=412755 RepID=A0A0F9T016_9ZZZZ